MFASQLKTVVLLGALTGLMLVVGQLLGGATGLTIAIVIAVVMNFGMYWFSDRDCARHLQGKTCARSPIRRNSSRLCVKWRRAEGIPMPNVYIIPTAHSNAFATGRSPSHASIAFTQGILNLLSTEELKGVAAHEIAHVKNRDTLISTIAATIAGVISYVAMMARFGAIFGGGDRDRGSNILELIVLGIVTPLIAMVIQMAISRSREYLADQTAAKAIPQRLGTCLCPGETGGRHQDQAPPADGNDPGHSHLFIAKPLFSGKSLMNLFYPSPIPERVSALKSHAALIS